MKYFLAIIPLLLSCSGKLSVTKIEAQFVKRIDILLAVDTYYCSTDTLYTTRSVYLSFDDLHKNELLLYPVKDSFFINKFIQHLYQDLKPFDSFKIGYDKHFTKICRIHLGDDNYKDIGIFNDPGPMIVMDNYIYESSNDLFGLIESVLPHNYHTWKRGMTIYNYDLSIFDTVTCNPDHSKRLSKFGKNVE